MTYESPVDQFRRRRQLLLGSAAALVSMCPVCRVAAQTPAKPLLVGGLPVTCNLTLPVACAASESKTGQLFEFSKYSGWPELKESLMTGRIKAAYMLAPLMMDLADKNLPVKV